MNKNRVPKASPEPLPELATFLEPFAPLFRRHTSRDSMERYLTGLLTDLPHKTCDTIAEVIAGTSIERLQHLLTDAAWDPLELDEARVKRLLSLHPVTDGILVFDDTGLPKKGTTSVGVAPQYSGTLGKIGNCQVVVSAEYLADDPASSTPFHFPVSAQLFLPESWTQDAQRRKQARVPEEITQQTKPEIALELLDRARLWGMPIQAVVVDAGYGDNPNASRKDSTSARCLTYVPCKAPLAAVCLMRSRPPLHRHRSMVGADSRASPVPRRSIPSKNSSRRCLPLPGKPSVGEKGRKARCRSRRLPSGSIGPPAPLCTAQATAAFTPDPKAGCWPNAQCQKPWLMTRNPLRLSRKRRKKRRSNTGSACCQRRPHSRVWFCWPMRAGSLSSFTKMPNRNAASITTRDAVGMDSIDTWPWSCWPTVSLCFID
jgi:hypothetical protein